jgi:hypothetical protein
MPSSISRCQLNVPAGPWLRTWFLAVLGAGLVLSAMEIAWRTQGHQPTVVDDLQLWACERARVYNNNPHTFVLVGDSRVVMGFCQPHFRAQFPNYDIVQLAVGGLSPGATIRDLADDPHFVGTVFIGMSPSDFNRQQREEQAAQVAYYHHHSALERRLNRCLAIQLQSRFVCLNNNLSLWTMLLRREWPLPSSYFVTLADRSRPHNEQRLKDTPEYLEKRLAKMRREIRTLYVPPPSEWIQDAQEIEEMLVKLRKRGCKVVVFALPLTGALWEYQNTFYPRHQYWDVFAARSCATCIHFKDVPELAALPMYDMCHADSSLAPAYTEAITNELVRRGVLEPSRP